MMPEKPLSRTDDDPSDDDAPPTRNLAAPPPARTAAGEGGGAPNVPGYTVVRMIGLGSKGAVWEAVEHKLERRVALKVHTRSKLPEQIDLMWSEARLTAKITHPGVVPVHDFGLSLDGDPFYTMELVEGTDLEVVLSEAPLAVGRALELAGEIASAVGAAHESGIVHRDLKPRNVLVDPGGHARVVDFGLAREVGKGESRSPRAGGTPAYMAPEQLTRGRVGPPADVYAIGCIFYEMLTGELPWTARGDIRDDLRSWIATEPPVPPSQRNPAVPANVEALCLRCLASRPEERFPTATSLSAAIEALRLGKSITPTPRTSARPPPPVAISRRTPPGRDAAPVHRRWTFTLSADPEALWPHVSNTDRLNRALGLSAVVFTDHLAEGSPATRTGFFQLFGMEIEWDERPFEWVHGSEYSIFRQYRKGPVAAVWNAVHLSRREGGGTDLVHEVWVVPHGLTGRLATFVELDQKTGKNLGAIYGRIDHCVTAGHGEDPFEPTLNPTAAHRRFVDRATDRLASLGFDRFLVVRLATYALIEPQKRIERMRPFELADDWGVDRSEMLELFVQSAYAGLLELSWDAVCPSCRVAHESFRTLSHMAPGSTCGGCGTAYERDLGRSVEIVFRPHGTLRNASPSTYCAGAPALRPHIVVQQSLEPGERRAVELVLAPGDYSCVLDDPGQVAELTASSAGYASEAIAVIRDGRVAIEPRVLRDGRVRLVLCNESDRPHLLRIEHDGIRDGVVTAAMVLTHPSFHGLFTEELLGEAGPVAVRRLCFLVIDLAGRAELFAQHGDAGVWAASRRLELLIDHIARDHGGVRIAGPVSMYALAFSAAEGAINAALAIQEAWPLQETAGEPSGPLRASIHDGPCIAATREAQIEYFGKTLDRAVALLSNSPIGGVALSDGTASDHEVATRIRGRRVTAEVTRSTGGAYAGMRITRLHPVSA